ncbi:unnamed protein product [Cladocopium goreaui]|uniref:RNase H type-1 domain-containing protein n=1 Tax=Cladocopium goreaui TaxID=2562237 RepID=A0A9P1GNK7_9DINO|nr:unnamed protein product [Cladocopium goreaui]
MDTHFFLPTYDLPSSFPFLPVCLQWTRDWWEVNTGGSHLCLYFDGSCLKTAGGPQVGAAVAAFIWVQNCWQFAGALSTKLEKAKTAYQAEIAASILATKFAFDLLKLIGTNHDTALTEVQFCYDSLTAGKQTEGAWQAVSSPEAGHLLRSLHKCIQQRFGSQVHYKHVKAHSGEPGNELVDTLAHQAALGSPLHDLEDWLQQMTAKTFVSYAEWFWFFFRSDVRWDQTDLLLPAAPAPFPESVMQQFEDAQLHIFALQETRLKRQYGILIGLARHRPIGHLYKNGVVQKVFFAQDDVAVVVADPRFLILRNDFVGLPAEWVYDTWKSWVSTSIDVGPTKEDHRDDLTSLFDAWQTERSPWKSQVRAVAKKHQMQEELENCRAQLVISDQPEFAMDKGALLGDALSDATQQWFCRYFPSGPSEAAKQELIDTWIQILCIDFGENNPLWDNWLAFVFLAWGDHWLPDIIAGFVDGEAEQIVDELYADFATELPRYQVLSRVAFLESSLRHCVETPPAPHRPVQIERPGLKHPKTNSRVRQPIEREPEELDAWIDCAAKASAAIRANAQRLPDFQNL